MSSFIKWKDESSSPKSSDDDNAEEEAGVEAAYCHYRSVFPPCH